MIVGEIKLSLYIRSSGVVCLTILVAIIASSVKTAIVFPIVISSVAVACCQCHTQSQIR